MWRTVAPASVRRSAQVVILRAVEAIAEPGNVVQQGTIHDK